ncbi:Codeine 3-O-demethylase [Bertholletia excelsa]
MVREDCLNVPERYIRNQEEMLTSTDQLAHLSSEIPVIDMFLLSNGDEEELKKLELACKEWGFFQVVNYGVAEEVQQKMKDASAEFFNLPLEDKKKFSMPPNDIQGYGQAYVVSEEQKLDWSDALILVVYPPNYRKLNLWPDTPDQFKEIIELYSEELRKVAEELLGSLSVIMGVDKEALARMHKEMVQALRINYYPTCTKPDQVLGLSPHSDKSSITILSQEDNVEGFQIRHNGKWMPATPTPNALAVIVGDVIEMWSNGKYKSIEHRVVTNKSRPRISCISFLAPHDDAEIEPLEHMIDSDSPRMYKKIRYGDFLRQSLKQRMQGKAHMQMEIAREDCLNVSERYIRDQDEMPTTANLAHLSSEVPVIDMFLLSSGQEELNKLELACREWGFLRVVNHGIAAEVLQNTKNVSAKFFDLPLEDENKFLMPPHDIQGYGDAYVVSEEQKLDSLMP